ncbi:two-component sensor histidine kinase, partial [Streptomyces hundungensis]
MTPIDRARPWLRAHPLALDAALAVGVLICMVIGSFADPHGPNGPTFGTRTPGPRSLVLMTLGAGALVLRRRAPMAVLAVMTSRCG